MVKLKFVILFVCSVYFLNAQKNQIEIEGKIIDQIKKTGIEFVSILQNGKQVGISNNLGYFKIKTTDGVVLDFTINGYEKKSFKVIKNISNLIIELSPITNELEVVTAFGIKKSPKALTYSTAYVSGKEIASTQRNSLVNGLQGRVAGLSISPTNGLAGSSNQIVLRGFNSLYDNTPLFIIDGVVVNNSSVQENNPNTGLISGRGENRQNDYANRINDISPEDIESVSVLKGPEATALYGSQASSGAIIITLKKGSTNGRLNVSYSPNIRVSKFQNLPSILYGYNAGSNGVNSDVFSYFGTKLSETTPRFDNINNFFETGITNNQNISIEVGKADKNIRASINYLDDKSPVPNNTFKRINYTITGFYKYKNLFDLTASSSIIFSDNIKPLRGINGFLQSLYIWPETNDIRNWKTQDQTKIALFSANPNSDQDNPLFSAYKVRSGEKLSRNTNSLGINIYPAKWLVLSGRFGYENYYQENFTQYDSSSFFISRIVKGLQDNYYKKYNGYNHTITAAFSHSIKDYNFRLMLGTMYQNYEDQIVSVSGNGLLDFIRTDSSNITTAKLYSNNYLRNGLPNYSIYRQFALFAELSINWKKMIFFNSTIRKEESSVFPEKNRNYYYPSAGISVILSEIFPTINSGILNYWKIRTTFANTARAISPYSNQAILQPNLGSGGGYNYGFTKANEDLKPERQETFEIGTELNLFSNRLKLDLTFYQNTNYDLIFENFRSSYGTGFILNTLNVGVNQNKGLEISLDYLIVNNKNFSWKTKFNFSKVNNKILELYYNAPELYNSDTWVYANARNGLIPGGSGGSITSFGYLRDENTGKIIIDRNTGLPRLDALYFRKRGDRTPDFTLGWQNILTYKNLSISFLWDLKVGGDIVNLTDMYLTRSGRSTRTADRLMSRVVDGILDEGIFIDAQNKAYITNPKPNNIVITPYYQNSYYANLPEEEFIEKNINWFRLRDFTISYSINPKSLTKYIKSLSIYTTITDPILFTNYTGGDPQVSVSGAGSRGTGGWGFDYLNIGTPISITLGLRANF